MNKQVRRTATNAVIKTLAELIAEGITIASLWLEKRLGYTNRITRLCNKTRITKMQEALDREHGTAITYQGYEF